MDKQTLNWLLHSVFAVAFAAIGFVGKMIVDDVTHLADKVDEIPTTYVLRSDYQHDQDKLLMAIDRLGLKLDTATTNMGSKIESSSEKIEADYNRRLDKLEKLLQDSLVK